MARILITEQIDGAAVDLLSQNHEVLIEHRLWSDTEQLEARSVDIDAIIVRNQTQVTANLIQSASHLKVIGRAGAGLDNIDCDAATKANVVVCYTPSENSLSVAELVMGYMLSLARNIPTADRSTSEGNWERKRFTGSELSGKTLGIIGFGRIGTLVAQRANAFGMTVIAHDEFLTTDAPHLLENGVELMGLSDLLSQSDFVSCHTPLTEDTRGFVNSDFLSQMKHNAYLINASRGEVINESDLVVALESEKISGAALDVREVEPPIAGKLEAMTNVLLTPHIGAFTREAQDRVIERVCHDVDAVLRGEPATSFFNFPLPISQP